MTQDMPEEPLKNIDLESAILGLRMTLTPEEENEARQKFLDLLRDSILAVPTINAVPTAPDGSIAPNADIQLVIATDPEGVSGVPAFTQLAILRQALPELEHGMFLSGAQISGILAGSEHVLFVDGPDVHAEVSPEEMGRLATTAQLMAQMQQQAAGKNERLETALAALHRDDTAENREAVIRAFMEEFTRIPVAGDADEDAECIVLSTGAPTDTPDAPQELELLTEDDALLCFTGEDAMRVWDQAGRKAVVLPGPVIAQMAAQAEVFTLLLNKGSETQRSLRITDSHVEILS